jgi:hypothetical protein
VDSVRPSLAALAVVVVLAGCGGGGGNGGGGDGGGNRGAAYDAAFDICSPGVEATADIYAVEATREAVASIVVEQVSGGSPQDEQSARQGCLDALDQAGGG